MDVVTGERAERRDQASGQTSVSVSREDILAVLRKLRELQASASVKVIIEDAKEHGDVVQMLALVAGLQQQALAECGYESEAAIATWNRMLETVAEDREVAAALAECRVHIDMSELGAPEAQTDADVEEVDSSHCVVGCANCGQSTLHDIDELLKLTEIYSISQVVRCEHCRLPYPYSFSELLLALRNVCEAMAQLRPRHAVAIHLDSFSLPAPYGPQVLPSEVSD